MTKGPNGDKDRQNPTNIGETGAEEKVGDKSKGLPENAPAAKPGDRQDADGTLTASSENKRNDGRGDIAVHHDAGGSKTVSRATAKGSADVPLPENADGTTTSNRQTNTADDARRAGFEPDATDAAIAKEAK